MNQKNQNPYIRMLIEQPYLFGQFIGFKELLPLHNAWILQVWGNTKHVALMAFRSSYKTSSCIVTGALRNFLLFPDETGFLIRKTNTVASEVVDLIKNIATENNMRIFCKEAGLKFGIENSASGIVKLTERRSMSPEANLTAHGVGDKITGSHVDYILADDVVSMEDRYSAAEREKTRNYVMELKTNIAKIGSKTKWTGTKWESRDAWEIIDGFVDKKYVYPASQYWFGTDEELEDKKKSTTPMLYAANYELSIVHDESLLFQNPKYGPFDPDTWRTRKVFMHVDAAYSGDDTTAITVFSFPNYKGYAERAHVKTLYGKIKQVYDEYHCQFCLIETNADKGYAATDLRNMGINTIEYHEGMNKQIKIETHIYGVWSDLIADPETNDMYMEQLLYYNGKTGPDDSPDSLSVCVRYDRNIPSIPGQARKIKVRIG
ncbi:hypothetical protein FACS1894151_08190 [Spirochaetia bacterium]|nr:hypothetical protein FACS1894151_08190 [Spirochaetia bacterium]